MDLPAAEGLGAKVPIYTLAAKSTINPVEQGHQEPQSGDTPMTYCPVQSQQRHPLPQPNIKAPRPVTDNHITTLLLCVISNFNLLPTYGPIALTYPH